MKIFNFKKQKIGKNYIKSASAYKMLARKSNIDSLDFSLDALYEHYYYGTYGADQYKQKYNKEEPDRRTNGYAYGEFMFDLTLKAIQEDLSDGHVCKIEFIYDYSIPWLLRHKIKEYKHSTELFIWRDCIIK